MAFIEAIVGPVSKLLDKIIPDPQARDRAKLELIKLQGDRELQAIGAQMQAIVAEAQSPDPWTSRARPSFLYVMYALILWAIPMGLIAAVDPKLALGIGPRSVSRELTYRRCDWCGSSRSLCDCQPPRWKNR